MAWFDAAALETLKSKGRLLVRHDGDQILLVQGDTGIFAVDNRCPHEGYPLYEGALAGCVLTCHWHNWKFDLASGDTLVGEDRLRHYPVQARDDRILIDVAPPDPAAARRQILGDLDKALAQRRQGQILREAARYMKQDGDPLDLVRHALSWVHARLEYGTSHAIAVTPDWLMLAARHETTQAERLVAIGEVLGHIADDAFGEAVHPFASGDEEGSWDAAAFLAAIEDEDEARAWQKLRAALRSGIAAETLRPVLARAALAHYASFGHCLIYGTKTLDLIALLGPEAAEPLLAMLVRSLVYATREDLLPEFSAYAGALAAWGNPLGEAVELCGPALRGRSVRDVLRLVAGWGEIHAPEQVFEVLVGEAAWMLLHADTEYFERVDISAANSVNWLDFTHAITFAEAGWRVATETPDLWPALLLQLACFIGRNAGFTKAEIDIAPHFRHAAPASLQKHYRAMFDHGRERFIISAHLLKTFCAADKLTRIVPRQAEVLLAGLDRFLATPMKGRHTLRMANQTLDLIGG